ncbi:MAG TPA: hypothetical protein VGL39_03370 [Jatrophihabitantaceae bacterium]|jgi:Mce-associated membrane protein
MTDDENPTGPTDFGEATSNGYAAQDAPRSPRAAAAAASRARRIGGAARSATEAVVETAAARPKPGPTQEPADTTDAEPAPAKTRVAGTAARRPSPGSRIDALAEADLERTIRKSRRRRWIPAAVAVALVVALAIVDGLLWQDWRNQPGKSERRERLVASVNVAVAKVLSYDYRHLDADEAAASGYLTGKFKDQYVASMNTTIKPGAPDAHAVVIGEVGSSAVTSVSGDGKQAVLLVLGQQTVTNTTQKQPRYDVVSLRVTAQLVHGKWLVADLATL